MAYKIKRIRKISITNKFILYFLAVYMVTVSAIIGSIYYSSKNALLERTFDHLTSVKVVKTRQIETFFHDRINDINNLAIILKDFNKKGRNNQFINQDDLSYYISSLVKDNSYFDGYILYNIKTKKSRTITKSDTDVIVTGPVLLELLKNCDTISKPIIKDYFINPLNKKPELYGFCQINNTDNGDEILGLRISNSAINNIMLENNPNEGLGETGESYLVGPDTLMRSKSRFFDNTLLKTKVRTEGFLAANRGETGTKLINDYRGIKVLSSYSPLLVAGLNWTVLAEIDFEETQKPVYEIRMNIFIISITFSFTIFMITIIITRKITQPLIMLTKAATNLGKGEFVPNLKISANDEIGDLTDSFNVLSENLRAKDKQLTEEQLKRFSLVIDAQEEEKARLSRELHDGIGQMFIALKLKLESIETENDESTLNDVKNGLNETIDEIRRISNNLMPAMLNELGLTTAVNNLCTQLSKVCKINFNFETDLEHDIEENKKKIYIFRIVQEALNNIVKYSNAKNADLKLFKNDFYQLIISDDGKGFSYDEAIRGSGNGLYNIRERVRSLKGKINFESSEGNGTVIIINIPLN